MTFLQDGILTIDNSSLETSICPREFQYAVLQRKKARGGTASALDAGKGIHAALDLYYKGETDIDILSGQIIKHLPESPGEWRTPALYIVALTRYIQHWARRDFTPFSHDGNNFVELPFAAPLGRIKVSAPFTHAGHDYAVGDDILVIYSGRVDLVARDNADLWAVDHKTASMTGDSYWEHFWLSQQTMGYVWAVQQCLEVRIKGAILNAIIVRKPTAKGVSNMEFDRRPYLYTQAQLAEWQEDRLAQCSAILHHLAEGYFPKNTICCVKARAYGTCQFAPICRGNPARRKDMEDVLLEDNHWSPLNDE